MDHSQLEGKEETLKCIINANDMFVATLLAQGDFMHPSVEQEILALPTSYERNGRLLKWLRKSSSKAFEAFVSTLVLRGQSHVANFILDLPGKIIRYLVEY
jgi:hypothetical protein